MRRNVHDVIITTDYKKLLLGTTYLTALFSYFFQSIFVHRNKQKSKSCDTHLGKTQWLNKKNGIRVQTKRETIQKFTCSYMTVESEPGNGGQQIIICMLDGIRENIISDKLFTQIKRKHSNFSSNQQLKTTDYYWLQIIDNILKWQNRWRISFPKKIFHRFSRVWTQELIRSHFFICLTSCLV